MNDELTKEEKGIYTLGTFVNSLNFLVRGAMEIGEVDLSDLVMAMEEVAQDYKREMKKPLNQDKDI